MHLFNHILYAMTKVQNQSFLSYVFDIRHFVMESKGQAQLVWYNPFFLGTFYLQTLIKLLWESHFFYTSNYSFHLLDSNSVSLLLESFWSPQVNTAGGVSQGHTLVDGEAVRLGHFLTGLDPVEN